MNLEIVTKNTNTEIVVGNKKQFILPLKKTCSNQYFVMKDFSKRVNNNPFQNCTPKKKSLDINQKEQTTRDIQR